MSEDNKAAARDAIREAMSADEKIDQLKAELDQQLKARSEALSRVAECGIKRFQWQGLTLTIFRKGEGLWSLKGKKQNEKDIFSAD